MKSKMSPPVVCSSSRIDRELIDHRTPFGKALLVQLLRLGDVGFLERLLRFEHQLAGLERVGRLLEVGPILPIVVVGIVLVVDRELKLHVFPIDVARQLQRFVGFRRLLLRDSLGHVAIGDGHLAFESPRASVLARV